MFEHLKFNRLTVTGMFLLTGLANVTAQQLPYATGKVGNWKKAYHNVGIDTTNTTLNSLTLKEAALGWELLFNGTRSDAEAKWKAFQANYFPNWTVDDNALARINGAGDIMTRKSYKNFVWALEWRISVGGNSGIFYHADESESNGYFTGPEVQVLHNQRHSDGLNQDGYTSAGAMYDMFKPINQGEDPKAPPVVNPNSMKFFDATSTDASGNPSGYNKVLIIVNGNKHEYWLNGTRIISLDVKSQEFLDQKANRKFKSYSKWAALVEGFMFLQDHGDPVWYRNIKVRPLPDNASFDQIWPGTVPTVPIMNLGDSRSILQNKLSIQRSSGGFLVDFLYPGSYQLSIRNLRGELLAGYSGQGGAPIRVDQSRLPSAGPFLLTASGDKATTVRKVVTLP